MMATIDSASLSASDLGNLRIIAYECAELTEVDGKAAAHALRVAPRLFVEMVLDGCSMLASPSLATLVPTSGALRWRVSNCGLAWWGTAEWDAFRALVVERIVTRHGGAVGFCGVALEDWRAKLISGSLGWARHWGV